MSNGLMPRANDIAMSSQHPNIYLGNQSVYSSSLLLRAGASNFNLRPEMHLAAMSANTNLLAKQVENLQSPPSPSALSFVLNELDIGERLFDATAEVKMLTAKVAMHMEKNWRDKLFSQIDLLHELDSWDKDDKPISKLSYSTFLKAILQIKPQRLPGLGLSYEGYLIAAWTTGQDQLTTEFLPKDQVRWVLSCIVDGESERAAGLTAVARLYECLMPYHPDRWFMNEKS